MSLEEIDMVPEERDALRLREIQKLRNELARTRYILGQRLTEANKCIAEIESENARLRAELNTQDVERKALSNHWGQA